MIEKLIYEFLRTSGITSGYTYNLPIYLESTGDIMGIMTEFDGDICQTEETCNFTYNGSGSTLTIYNSVNTNDSPILRDSVFTVNWDDGSSSGLTSTSLIGNPLPSVSHTYSTNNSFTVELSINSPWRVNKIRREITIPFVNSYGFPTDFGTLTFTIPYTEEVQTQDYLQDYRTLTGDTNPTPVSFLAIGKSRLDEFKKYGTSGEYTTDVTTGTTDLGIYTGYSIDGLFYMDYNDGYTHITGSTTGTTGTTYINEEVYTGMITRQEMLIGFIDNPQIYSDIFVERGKQSIMERNLRLGEINNIGELEIYGGGYFNVKKE